MLEEMKVCKECGINLPTTDYHVVNKETGALNTRCKPCVRIYVKRLNEARQQNENAREHQPEYKNSRRAYQQQKLYGLNELEQAALLQHCAICKTTENLHTDHDHDNGAVRGILCREHNLGLGWFRDNPEHLLLAVEYLAGNLEVRYEWASNDNE